MTEHDLAVKHFDPALKALYDLAGLFVTGPLRKEGKRPEVRAAIAALAQIAKDKPAETTPPRAPGGHP